MNNYPLQSDNSKIITSITRAKTIIKTHMQMIQNSIDICAQNDQFEMCSQLKNQKIGMSMALEDVSSLEIGMMTDVEYVEVDEHVWHNLQKCANQDHIGHLKMLIELLSKYQQLMHEAITYSHDKLILHEITQEFCSGSIKTLQQSIEKMEKQ